jgi:hypothetical protein
MQAYKTTILASALALSLAVPALAQIPVIDTVDHVMLEQMAAVQAKQYAMQVQQLLVQTEQLAALAKLTQPVVPTATDCLYASRPYHVGEVFNGRVCVQPSPEWVAPETTLPTEVK